MAVTHRRPAIAARTCLVASAGSGSVQAADERRRPPLTEIPDAAWSAEERRAVVEPRAPGG